MLARRGIRTVDELVITNCDEDHASDLPNVLSTVHVGCLVSNPTIKGPDLYDLKAHGGMGAGIAALADMTRYFRVPVVAPVNFDGMARKQFWNCYPADFEDENNLSLVHIMRWLAPGGGPGFSILYGGDMERSGWLRLLNRPDFRRELRHINVFVASHHGRFNGYCAELFEVTGLAPDIFVISDCGIQHATQETVALYRRHARGIDHNGEFRRVITTRRDGWLCFDIQYGYARLATAR